MIAPTTVKEQDLLMEKFLRGEMSTLSPKKKVSNLVLVSIVAAAIFTLIGLSYLVLGNTSRSFFSFNLVEWTGVGMVSLFAGYILGYVSKRKQMAHFDKD